MKAGLGMPLTEAELSFFQSVAGGRDPPSYRVREFWCVAGEARRQGCDREPDRANAAALFDQQGKLRAGERALVICLACDRVQARIVHDYTAACFREVALLNPLLARETNELFELSNGVDIAMATSFARHRWYMENDSARRSAFRDAVSLPTDTKVHCGP